MPYLPHVRPDHDETLIARLAVDDLDEREASAARALVAECPACAELLSDLRLIAAATAVLPAPSRTRDFRLTEADAARLRPGGWRGLVARFGTPSYAFAKPLGAGLATLGIAGLILASIPAGLGGSASSALSGVPAGGAALDTTGGPIEAAGQAEGGGAKAAAGAAASPAALAPAVPPAAASGAPVDASSHAPAVVGGGDPDPGSGSRDVSPIPEVAVGAASTQPAASVGAEAAAAGQHGGGSTFDWNPLVVLSLTLLVVGLALGSLRLLAGRLV